MTAYDDFDWVSAIAVERLALAVTPWRHYRNTAVHFDTPKLTGLVQPIDGNTGGDVPPLGPLHVVTATQPTSQTVNSDDDARMVVFDSELEAAGIRAIRAVGTSFDGTYHEESRAVFGLDDKAARLLGRRFGQVALFAWSGPRWSLLACVDERRDDRAWRWHECDEPVRPGPT